MIGMDFYKWYEKSPNEAITALIIMISIVIIGFSVMGYSKHLDKKRRLQEQRWEEQFKRKYNIKG